MKNMILQFSLPVAVLRERKRYVAYTSALDLSTSGRTVREAKKRFTEAAHIFLEEIIEQGTADEVLGNLGWHKVQRQWKPPVVVAQQSEIIRIPA